MRIVNSLLMITLILLGTPLLNPAETNGQLTGKKAPDFILYDLDGKKYQLSNFKGKNVVHLIFWATWCPNCRAEIPRLKALYNKYNKKGLKILAINIGVNDSKSRAARYKKKYDLPYPILYDTDQSVTKKYGVFGVPNSFIIDRNGIIRYRGVIAPETDDSTLRSILIK